MAHYLSAHPDIYMPTVKEMHLFGSDLKFTGAFFRRRMDAYLAEYSERTDEQRAGEASVWYLFSTRAAEEIKKFNPDASIIIMLREPVEMLYSLYYQFLYDGNEHLATFEQALKAEGDRRLGKMLTRHSAFPQGLVYRETARFTEQVRRYFEVFGRDRVHVIIYDDLANDPAGVYREALEFLEVDPSLNGLRFGVVNPTKFVKSSVLRSILNDRMLRHAAHGVCARLPRKVFTTLRRAEGKIWRSITRYGSRPALSASLRARLKREFVGEVDRLGELLGRDLSHWSK